MTEMDYRAEAAEAKDLVETLLERVRDGDDSITPDEIENARRLAEFAELRGEAAERKAWNAGRDVAAEEQASAAQALKELVATTPKDITAAEQKAIKAFEALMSAVDERYVATFRAARRLRIANDSAAAFDLPDSAASHGVAYNARANRFEWLNERGSKEALGYDHLKDPSFWVRAVIEPARVRIPRGTTITSTRKPERLLEQD